MAAGDAGVDELYGLDPIEFVAARNDLVKRLRREGDRALAAEVATLKRPTPAAWAVNQLARRYRDDLEELVRLGQALRDAQDRALAGDDPGDLRQAGRARRDAVARLVDRAGGLLAGRGGAAGAHGGEVAATLEAASLDARAGAAVLAGRLAAELSPPSGFGGLDMTVALGRPAPPAEAEAEPGLPAPDDRARREAEEAVAEARRRWEAQRDKAREALARVGPARHAVEEAEAEVADLEERLAAAHRRRRAAARDAELAEDTASQADDSVARSAERLRHAERRLHEL